MHALYVVKGLQVNVAGREEKKRWAPPDENQLRIAEPYTMARVPKAGPPTAVAYAPDRKPSPGKASAPRMTAEWSGSLRSRDKEAFEGWSPPQTPRCAVAGGILRRREGTAISLSTVEIKAYFSIKRFDQARASAPGLQITVNRVLGSLKKEKG